VTWYATKFLIFYFRQANVIEEDPNKDRPLKLPASGGVAVAFGLVIGIMVYTFGGTFVFKPLINISVLTAAALSIMLITFVGFLDDINVSIRQIMATGMKSMKRGLKKWQKPLLTVVGAIPLMAINAGISMVNIPFLG